MKIRPQNGQALLFLPWSSSWSSGHWKSWHHCRILIHSLCHFEDLPRKLPFGLNFGLLRNFCVFHCVLVRSMATCWSKTKFRICDPDPFGIFYDWFGMVTYILDHLHCDVQNKNWFLWMGMCDVSGINFNRPVVDFAYCVVTCVSIILGISIKIYLWFCMKGYSMMLKYKVNTLNGNTNLEPMKPINQLFNLLK